MSRRFCVLAHYCASEPHHTLAAPIEQLLPTDVLVASRLSTSILRCGCVRQSCEAEGERLGRKKGNCWCASGQEQVEQHQPTSRQEATHRQQEEEHLLSRVVMGAGNQPRKGQAVQREQEQRGYKRQEKPTPALRDLGEEEAADLGQGVVLGSNLFNLAMLLGLSAVLAGQIRIRRQGLLLDGTTALFTMVVVAAMLLGLLFPLQTVVLLAVLLIPYVLLVGLHPRQVDHLPLPDGLAHVLAVAASQIHGEHKHQQETEGSWLPVFLVPLSLLTIVLTSVGLVQAALTLAYIWHLPHALLGGVILAALTSLPNAYTAAHLARRERGAAVVSATVNSNTINLVVGLALPALLIGMGSPAHGVGLELAWLLVMTVISLLLLLPTKGMTRVGG